jgi:AraC-like DNA-binding protein
LSIERNALLAEMRQLIGAHAHRSVLPIDGLALVRVESMTPPTSSIAEPTLAVVAQGAKRLVAGDHVVEYGPGDYLVVSVGLPVTGEFTAASPDEPFLGLGLDLDPATIAELVIDMPRPATRLPAGPALAASPAGGALLDALVRLLRLLDQPADIPVLAPLIRREVLWRLLNDDHRDLVGQIGLEGSSLAQIGWAVRWIRDHFAEPFLVEELAGRVGMSASSFHRHFRAAAMLGPIQFQKKIRLQQARLLLAGSGADVTRTARAVGYESPSQFSREYRREFGLPPRQDHRSGGR